MPSLAGTVVFVLAPFLNVVVQSFFQVLGKRFVGMGNFIQVWNTGAFWLAVKNNLRFTLVCIPILMVFSLWTAVLIYGMGRGGNLYKTTLMLPMAIPVASVVLLWKLAFYPAGLLNQCMNLFGAEGRDWLGRKSAFYVLVFTYIWKNMGYAMMLWLAGLNGISTELFEAARVDGAGSWQRFRHVTMPGLKSTLFLVLILSVINSFKVFREAYLIGGDYPHESIYMLQHLFNNWFLSLDIQKMSAASMMIEGAVLLPALGWMKWRRKAQ